MAGIKEIKQVGLKGEELVAQYLERQGYKVIARNYIHKTGELDLVAAQDDLIAFVEVKARTNSFFDLTEVISVVKQNRIISCARHFIMQQRLYDKTYRFDVALIEHIELETIQYIPDAFRAQEW